VVGNLKKKSGQGTDTERRGPCLHITCGGGGWDIAGRLRGVYDKVANLQIGNPVQWNIGKNWTNVLGKRGGNDLWCARTQRWGQNKHIKAEEYHLEDVQFPFDVGAGENQRKKGELRK